MTYIFNGSKDAIMKRLDQANYGEHNLIIYRDLSDFSELYAGYTKEHLQANNELVAIFTCYQTPTRVRAILSNAGIDVSHYERENTLTIVDSMRVYSDPRNSINSFFRKAFDFASRTGKSGIVAFGDMSSFVVSSRVDEMLQYERSNPPNLSEGVKIKAFCALHAKDFDRLSSAQKEALLTQHLRALTVVA